MLLVVAVVILANSANVALSLCLCRLHSVPWVVIPIGYVRWVCCSYVFGTKKHAHTHTQELAYADNIINSARIIRRWFRRMCPPKDTNERTMINKHLFVFCRSTETINRIFSPLALNDSFFFLFHSYSIYRLRIRISDCYEVFPILIRMSNKDFWMCMYFGFERVSRWFSSTESLHFYIRE